MFDLRFTLHKLSVFCRVVDAGGVHRAAEMLYVAQPVVTAHVQSLEKRLGTELFERSGRAIRLTPAGHAVYEWASETLTRARELERELDGISGGTLGAATIAASMSIGSYVLPAILSDFRRDRPGAAVSLSISDPEHALEAIATGAADFAVIVCERLPELDGFDAEILGREGMALVVAPDYPIRTDDSCELSVEDIRRLPFIESPKGYIRRHLIAAQLGSVGLTDLSVVIELGHPEAMKRAARAGLGATVLFRSAVRDDLSAGLLREINIADTRLSVPVFLVRRHRTRLSRLQESLLSFVRARVEQELADAEDARATSPTVVASAS